MESTNNMIECPINAEWKFQKADIIALKDLNGKIFYAFNCPDIQYNVIVNQCAKQKTILFFYVNSSKERKLKVNVTAVVESANYVTKLIFDYQKYRHETIMVYEMDKFFDSKSKFFVNGELIIKVDGIMIAERLPVSKIPYPISLKWKIKEDDLKAKCDVSNGFLRSKRIASFSDVKYYLTIYPNRVKDGVSKTEVWLNVDLGKEKEIEAIYDISIETANINEEGHHYFKKSGGYPRYIVKDGELINPSKGYIVDGYMTITLNGKLMIEKNQYTMLNCKKGVATTAAQKKKNKDFVIDVDGKEIQVHKKVLMDASPVLSAMLESGMKEAIENRMIIEDFSFEVVDAAIKLCYSSSVPRKFVLEDLLSLYRFADKYRIQLIMDLVEEYLIKKLTASNVCQLIKFSKFFNAKKLYQSAVDILMKYSKESTSVSNLDILDNDLLAMIFRSTFCPAVDTDFV